MKAKVVLMSFFMLLVVGGCSRSSEEQTTKKDETNVEAQATTEQKPESATEKNEENNKEVEQKEIEEKKAVEEELNWEGQWYKVEDNTKETLEITNVKGNTFDMNLTVDMGVESNGLHGQATFDETTATHTDEWGFRDCTVTMKLTKDGVHVDSSSECGATEQMGTYFDGDYQKEDIAVYRNTLSSNNIVNETEDAQIQSLVGKEDYDILVKNMKETLDTSLQYKSDDSIVLEGRTAEYEPGAMIVMDIYDNIYIASIVGENKVKYYTNNPNAKDKVHYNMEQWIRPDYQIETVYKDV